MKCLLSFGLYPLNDIGTFCALFRAGGARGMARKIEQYNS